MSVTKQVAKQIPPIINRPKCPIIRFQLKENYSCTHHSSCYRHKPTHILRFHPFDHIPKNENQPNYIKRKYGNKNAKVLFHQTDYQSAFQIMSGKFHFKKTIGGLFGEGYYFATSIESTDRKASNKGIVLCAIVDLGEVKTMYDACRESKCEEVINSGYNTFYAPANYTFPRWGRALSSDEYIIMDDNQVLEGAWRFISQQSENDFRALIQNRKDFQIEP